MCPEPLELEKLCEICDAPDDATRNQDPAGTADVLDDLRAAVPRWHEIARGTRERKQLAEKRRR